MFTALLCFYDIKSYNLYYFSQKSKKGTAVHPERLGNIISSTGAALFDFGHMYADSTSWDLQPHN